MIVVMKKIYKMVVGFLCALFLLSGMHFVQAADSKFLFRDVPSNAWFYDSVRYSYDKGIMTGLDVYTFGPDQLLARAQFATILYRMEGTPEIKYSARFPDVANGQFYTNPVLWASKDGVKIITGYSNGLFGPSDSINREQMATMMYRYAKYKGFDITVKGDLSQYPDEKNVNDFAKQAMEWAVGSGLISGDGGRLNPQGNANRAVCATIMQRFLQKYESNELQSFEVTGINEMVTGTTQTIQAKFVPENAKCSIAYTSSNVNIANVDSAGRVTAKTIGNVTITAVPKDKVSLKKSLQITVKEPEITSIKVTGTSKMEVGDTLQFKAILTPETFISTPLNTNWRSSVSGIASVTKDGTVKALRAGKAVITAQAGNVSDGVEVNISEKAILPSSVNITGANKIYVGNTEKYSASVLPAEASQQVTWSTDNSALNIDSNGNATGKHGADSVTITAAAKNNKSATKKVKVIPITTSLSISGNNHIAVGDMASVPINVSPADAIGNISLTSSDPSVAVVENGFNIRGLKNGVVTLTALASDPSGMKATFPMIVGAGEPVQSLTLKAGGTELSPGNKIQIQKNVMPETAIYNTFEWTSSDTEMATVNSNGLVTAVGKKSGTVIVTCKSDSGVSAQIQFRVYDVEQGISITKFEVPKSAITVGDGTQISFEFSKPSFATYRFKSSNTSVATVTSKGYISGIGAGHATISIESTDGTILSGTTSLELDINEKEIITVTVDKGTIMVGDTAKATQIGSLTTGIWSSTNPNVATIDQSGNIKALASGTTNIRYQTANGGAGVNITVIDKQAISYLSISIPTDKVTIGNTIQFSKNVSPSDMSDYTKWTSSNNEIASIDENGLLTANEVGSVTITLSSTDGSNKSTSVVIYVNDGDKFTQSTANDNIMKYVNVGETVKLLNSKATTLEGCSTFSYESSNTNVATVDNEGNVTSKRIGNVTITQRASTGAVYRENLEIINPTGNYFRPYLNEVSINRGANCDFLLLGDNTNKAGNIGETSNTGGSTAYSPDYNWAFAAREVGTDRITIVNTDGYVISFKINILDSLNTSGISGMEFDANMSKQIMDGINAYRAQSGVKQLTFYQFAQDIAKAQALSQHRMASYAPQGYNYSYDMHNSIQISAYYWGYLPGAADIIQDWKDSPGHNDSMLRATDEVIGVAAYKTPYGYGVYVTKQTKEAVDSPFNW